MLILESLYAGYEEKAPILKGIDLHLLKGEAVAILGKNGAGKSTLAKAILNIVPYVSGHITFEGKSLNGLDTYEISRKHIGMFIQGGRIFPNLTVHENLNFASQCNGAVLNKSNIYDHIEKFCLSGVFDESRLRLKASYLGGGEQHLLALLMILLQEPSLLILDEPSAGLSPANIVQMYDFLTLIRNSKNITFLIIEQNVSFAVKFSDRAVLLQEGKIAKEEKCENLESADILDKFFFEEIITSNQGVKS